MLYSKLKVFLCLMLLLTGCNHTPYWRLVSTDCYEYYKADFVKDSLYYSEVEKFLPPYLDTVSYKDLQIVTLNTIDSFITDKEVREVLKRFLKQKKMREVIFGSNKHVHFTPTDFCVSEVHSGSHPTVIGDLTFKADTTMCDEQHCHDTIYCINYKLSKRWHYTTVVVH